MKLKLLMALMPLAVLAACLASPLEAPPVTPLEDFFKNPEYAAFQISVSQQEGLEAVIDLAGTTVSDTVMAVYCDPFDPANLMARLVAYDDDSGPGQLEAAFIAGDGVTLSPGPPGGPPRIYYLVVSSFSPGDFGTFRVNLTSGKTVQVVPVELQSFTVE